MKFIVIVLIGLIVLSGCIEKQVTKWEYEIAETTNEKGVSLNEYGFNGWELVDVQTIQRELDRQDYRFVFKRQLQEIEK